MPGAFFLRKKFYILEFVGCFVFTFDDSDIIKF